MKKLILIALFYFSISAIHGQSLITPFAGYSSNSTESISHSGGETLIATLEQDNIVITQGFHQQSKFVNIDGIDIPSLVLNSGDKSINRKLVLGFDRNSEQLIDHFIIYDASGKIIHTKEDFTVNEFQNWWRHSFNGSYLSGGIYFYYLEYSRQDKRHHKTGSITKL